MAEIVSLAFGTLSLGLQSCHYIIKYIDSAKQAKGRKSEVLKQLDYLADILESLDDDINKKIPSDTGTTAQLGIAACKAALEKVKKKLDIRSGSNLSQNIRAKLLYPFKEGDIKYCKDAVDSIQQTLLIALAALEREQRRQDTESIIRQIVQESQNTHNNLEIIDRQHQLQHQRTRLQLEQEAQLIKSDLVQATGHLPLIRSGISDIKTSLDPFIATVSQISRSVSPLRSDLLRLEAKLDLLTPATVSSQVIEDDVRQLTHVAHSIRNVQEAQSYRKPPNYPCTCRGNETSTTCLRWPLSLSLSKKRKHNIECPYAPLEDAISGLSLQFTMCNIALKRKIQVMLSISTGAGFSSITPMLRHSRFVQEDSPAFRLLALFADTLGPSPTSDVWKKVANELYKMFELREASPHDRLRDGKTLLHTFCRGIHLAYSEDVESYHSNVRAMGKCLLKFMPEEAFEKDDNGDTCVKYLHYGIHTQLVEDFFDHGVSAPIFIDSHGEWSLPLHNDELQKYTSVLECSERTRVILLRSAIGAQKLIDNDPTELTSYENEMTFYEMVTLAGWREGCEIILQKTAGISQPSSSSNSYISAAYISQEPSVLQFWLERRPHLSRKQLEYVGNLESSLDRMCWRAGTNVIMRGMVQTIISALVDDRRRLRTIAEYQLPPDAHFWRKDRLPDAQAPRIWSALIERGIQIEESLRPTRRSIYHLDSCYELELHAFSCLYDSGFHDLRSTDFHNTNFPISALLFNLTRRRLSHYPENVIAMTEWFISKGCDLSETWPRSNVLAHQILAHILGDTSYIGGYLGHLGKQKVSVFLYTHLQHPSGDSCSCACSAMGCTSLHSFSKGLFTLLPPFELRSVRLKCNYSAFMLARFIDAAYKSNETDSRWMIAEFIRMMVFAGLEIRHTCCDVSRIQHSGDPDFGLSPMIYTSEDDAREIMEEDEHLIKVLEELVERLDARYARFQGSLEDFLVWDIKPDLDKELQRLRATDIEMYSSGRRELGVMMHYGKRSTSEGDTEFGTRK